MLKMSITKPRKSADREVLPTIPLLLDLSISGETVIDLSYERRKGFFQ